MPIGLELQLEDRLDDRVLVSLCIAPSEGGTATVDGAALQLVDAAGEEVCPRILLPISGHLAAPMATTIELRANRALPAGCTIIGSAWLGHDVVQITCPADPFTNLRDHVRGSPLGLPDAADVDLDDVQPDELSSLHVRMPWVAEAIREPEAQTVIEMHEEATAEDLREDFGLGEEEAAWLNDLLNEPDL